MRWPRSPTVDLLAAFAAVFVAQRVGGAVGVGTGTFALAAPFARPWTLATSVYAHASVGHLLANAVALVVVGFALERFTTRARFHGFVLATGALAGLAQVLVGRLVGQPTAVLGASGAILALYGYVLAGNPLTGGVLARVDVGYRGRFLLLLLVAVAVTVATAGPGVALVAHFTGVVLGVLAGRLRVLQS